MFACPALVCTALLGLLSPPPSFAASDTLRLGVGSPEVDLSRMVPHDARVTVERLVGDVWEPVVEWTNHLKVGDSAGRAVHRWTTIGRRPGASGQPATWELYQTFDARSIAPLGLRRGSSEGTDLQLVFDGRHVRGTRKAGDGAITPVSLELTRAAFPAAASDLVPMAVRLSKGLVIDVPVWQPGMPDVETRVFDVVDRRDMTVAGRSWNAWVVEERAVRAGSPVFIGTWYIVDEPPYMIYAEVVGPGGVKQRMTEVPLERP
jgi:hypothetical protein